MILPILRMVIARSPLPTLAARHLREFRVEFLCIVFELGVPNARLKHLLFAIRVGIVALGILGNLDWFT